MNIVTIWNNGIFTHGATITMCNDQEHGKYPGICIGEEGPGRKKTSIKVNLFGRSQRKKWEYNNHVLNIISATIEKNGYDKYELIASDDRYNDPEKNILCVFRTHNGFCGTNIHTGDNIDRSLNEYEDFPGIILKCGKIAKGPTVETGVGHQLIAIMPPDCIFHTGCFRKVFLDYPSLFYYKLESYYYKWDGKIKELLGGFSLQERYELNIF